MKKTVGVFMPSAAQDLDGGVTVSLGAKGVIELELVSSGEKWGRGPSKDVHSSLKAMVDSPAWRLVQALDTLVSADGNTITIDDYPHRAADQRRGQGDGRGSRGEDATKRKSKTQLGVQHWIDDLNWEAAQRTAGIAADGEHRRPGRRLHRSRRQDRAAASRGGEDRHASRAGT